MNVAELASALDALDADGHAVVPSLLDPEACAAIAKTYDDDARFRSRVVMARHGFGRGEYKYFSYPLPPLIADLRERLYPALVPIANRWNEAMEIETRYPEAHADFLARCHVADQSSARGCSHDRWWSPSGKATPWCLRCIIGRCAGYAASIA